MNRALVGFILFLRLCLASVLYAEEVVRHPYERLNIVGESSNKGVFDPSVAYNRDGSVGYMVYSGLDQDADKLQFYNVRFIHTHLAKTTDHGKTWTFVKRLNESKSEAIKVPIGPLKIKMRGAWHHEVPSLVFDASDSNKPWKLFWHLYFSQDADGGKDRPRILTHSWIMFKEAATAEELENAQPVFLFATDTSNVIRAKYNFQQFGAKIEGGSTYTEPGSVFWNGRIYVTLSFFIGDGHHELMLISSSDHGQSWNYLGSLLDERDGFGPYRNFWGAELAVDEGRVFLLAPPIHKQYGYLGCYVFEFENIDRALLKRDNNGRLVPIKFFPRMLKGNLNTGQGDYDPQNTGGGLILGQVDLDSHPKACTLWNTHETLTN